MDSTVFLVLAIIAIAFQALLIVLAFFEPSLPYKVVNRISSALGSEDFGHMLALISDAQWHTGNRVSVLTNGESFYQEELDAIHAARHHINMEAYIFQKGEIAGRFIESLTGRAQAGVQVKLVLDAVGSFNTWRSTFRGLLEAGGRVEWYQPFRWYTIPRLNNRTHRELLIVDGRIGFIGGAGISDNWYRSKGSRRRWRDTMFRVEGPAVSSMQAMFAENWLESSGEVLVGEEYFPLCDAEGATRAMVINSAPSAGRSTRARMLFQTLLACARRSIHIETPYFLPDRSARAELVQTIQRGVEVKIVVPGKHADHLLTRTSSRRLYGQLLHAGARIFEYRPGMLHVKALVVDEIWSVVGSTNFDQRSFGLNDEVNLAALDPALARRLEEDFARDVADSREITYREWKRRSPFERMNEWVGWLVERQQ